MQCTSVTLASRLAWILGTSAQKNLLSNCSWIVNFITRSATQITVPQQMGQHIIKRIKTTQYTINNFLITRLYSFKKHFCEFRSSVFIRKNKVP